MDKVDNLIKHTQSILDCDNRSDNYGPIYFHSNEYLNEIFNEVDICGKDVLTVVGSGDQALYMYDRGVKNVDLFDKNKLTLYYYYLRVWTIKYLNKFYPEYDSKNKFLKKLLKFVKPSTEEEKIAFLYWKKFSWYFDKYDEDDFEELFILGNDPRRNELNDLYRIKPRIEQENYNFKNVDITSNGLDFGKKYDLIYTSNISDRIHSKEQMRIYKKNLLSHLNENGLIVCADVIRDKRTRLEECVFDVDMEMRKISDCPYRIEHRSPGHIYIRRK